MTRVDDRTRASPSRARARPRARPDGRAKGLLCTSCYALSAHPRRARADPRASSFSKPRLHRAASPALSPRPRPRPSSASSSSSRPRMPTPRCAPPPTSNEPQNRKTAPACAFEPIAPSRSRDRARDARRGAKRARDAREEHVPRSRAHTCPSRSAPPPRPPRPRPRGRRRDGSVAPPAKRRRRRLSVSAARERRFRASHLAVARQIFGDLSCERASLEKGVFARFRKKFFH